MASTASAHTLAVESPGSEGELVGGDGDGASGGGSGGGGGSTAQHGSGTGEVCEAVAKVVPAWSAAVLVEGGAISQDDSADVNSSQASAKPPLTRALPQNSTYSESVSSLCRAVGV